MSKLARKSAAAMFNALGRPLIASNALAGRMEGPHANIVPALIDYEHKFRDRDKSGIHLLEQDALNAAADLDVKVYGNIWANMLRRGMLGEECMMGRAFLMLHLMLVRDADSLINGVVT